MKPGQRLVTLLPDSGDVLAFWRHTPEQNCLVALNMSAHDVEMRLGTPVARRIFTNYPHSQGDENVGVLTLHPYQVWIGEAAPTRPNEEEVPDV